MRTLEDKLFAVLRIVFGFVWLIDASFKWSPAFINNLTDYLAQGAQGQPLLVQEWVYLWVHVVTVNPHFFAILVALAETAIAFGLISGFLTKIALGGGIAMALVIWSTAEGFGGPYAPGSTDIGTAIIYVIVFIALWLGKCWRHYSIDSFLKKQTRPPIRKPSL
jgi:thiosulfate dehydrogenase [quinone] large subunit